MVKPPARFAGAPSTPMAALMTRVSEGMVLLLVVM